ncbi:LTBP4 isoform 5 [Pongo abelii]|uniref:LTBP4 isoform 5 n=1 Tax=Pongo abelii TaxID=9601 RepID=A0A2J8SE55_PONAB|nr:LTBP4 isoform 5 [Pongo abelii]
MSPRTAPFSWSGGKLRPKDQETLASGHTSWKALLFVAAARSRRLGGAAASEPPAGSEAASPKSVQAPSGA